MQGKEGMGRTRGENKTNWPMNSDLEMKISYTTQQRRTCKYMQDCARILHARLAWHVHAICPFSCTILAQSCMILAQSCTYLARNFARDAARIIGVSCTFFARIGARLCKKMQEKGHRVHVPSKSCMQDSCKILAQSCMILQVRFCWVRCLNQVITSCLNGPMGSDLRFGVPILRYFLKF